jgi:hypothetical protein
MDPKNLRSRPHSDANVRPGGVERHPRFSTGSAPLLNPRSWLEDHEGEPELIVLNVNSPLMSAHKVLRLGESRILMTTFVRDNGKRGRALWSAVAPIHHRTEPYLLGHAVGSPGWSKWDRSPRARFADRLATLRRAAGDRHNLVDLGPTGSNVNRGTPSLTATPNVAMSKVGERMEREAGGRGNVQ